MELFPFNLVLAVAVASATMFLGFLPTKHLRAALVARESGLAGLAWFLVAAMDNSHILHIHFGIGLLCLCAWWQLRRERTLAGKVWLSIAAGLGVSVGVMFLLAVTPFAYPPGFSTEDRALLLASIYLGGGLVGLAYVCLTLTKALPRHADLEESSVRRYAGLLLGLVLAHGAVIAFKGWLIWKLMAQVHDLAGGPAPAFSSRMLIVLVLSLGVLPLLAFNAFRAVAARRLTAAMSALILLAVAGFASEILARILVL